MTLDDLERQNRGFYGFLGDFGLQYTFQEPTALNSLEIGLDLDNLHIQFSALNVDFNGGSRNQLAYICRFQMIIVHYAVSAIFSVINNNN